MSATVCTVDGRPVGDNACDRGCIVARRHRTTCDDMHCKGCQPREAEFGRLCYGCHQRLLNMLHTAPAQHALLLAVIEPSTQQNLTAEATIRYPQPRTDSAQPLHMQPANRTPASEGGEPLRLAAHDSALALTDILSAWVEMLVDQHSMAGPNQRVSQAQRDAGKHGYWRQSRWPLVEDEQPEAVWTEPPMLFEIGSASRWLLAQIDRLEHCAGIGDLWTELAEAMSQAHAVAPWREQSTALKGIECPECHRHALRLFGGDEDVTCTVCRASIPWSRYAVWVREIQQRKVTEPST